MIELSLTDLLDITGGKATATAASDTVITSVTTDSREVVPGALFVAKPGEFSDGHAFIDRARAAGAVLALAERVTYDEDRREHPAVIVDDAVEAMGKIAARIVAHLKEKNDAKVVGITGSAGKTTTKDLLAGILSQVAPTVSPIGSYNGEVGVPLTVFNATEETKYLVIEMGATGIGHLTYLTDMVHPQVGVVLCVGTAHAGEFGGVENIEKAKGELVEALDADGIAILNAEDPRVARMDSRSGGAVRFFGTGSSKPENAGVWATDVAVNKHGQPELTLEFPGGFSKRITSGLLGRHHVTNILAAANAALALDVAPELICAGLEGRAAGSRWRMERIERPDGVSIINDAYNANPESMRAALVTLAELGLGADGAPGRRTWAVLGEMLELGDDSIHQHDLLGRMAVRMNIKKLVVVGRGAKPAYNSAVLEGSWGDEAFYVEDVDEARALLQEQLQPGDIALFKSSNGAGLRFLGDEIAAFAKEGDNA
ncbi:MULTISPECIES: UDP-N-acetylmuramoyl-tripeptide--D-alanyl-D-alanine ligase [Glutamicibacter]|uniref:UDP-N-acetylmuramoyl-tripeptide--D-alanyl-D-alanine ligase n=1 Tax=Glutamicibacter nicotianae TaxID=37929 RepID=A0ABQ0RP89_GLUNI|nr:MULTISPECIES: UDP-N-acetylmuramoyl-tripeptide--D-alanyl-D-alanine ligase [Glutamicibacter]KWR73037.1 UDP-N-acetylmuramoyl-tripeptide--D-alanyl-D-alanine ligase [Arthrobacter sp. W1]QEP07605.1 UDP-N-acetylmuramoyl-tripeptide--D-alanyl-D-alanine ligase [Glutamicibacter sp. ZJUTW]WIV42785.1 UDP-N-acetylmuramoyl-tripeptide--D-alanyl-D-alanine ligase [Glutamicibacter nicotianae]GEC13331.1 UDP-N-acetylmuramoyl-tripeptide--D-alanyl-D-alanine ligase [Glutamicibacter nicotianae]